MSIEGGTRPKSFDITSPHPPPRRKARVVDNGLTIIADGGASPVMDVVFVHGLKGHPKATWSTSASLPQASAEEKSSLRWSIRGKSKALVPGRKKRPSASPSHQHVDSGGPPAPEDERTQAPSQRDDPVSELGEEPLDLVPPDLVVHQTSSTRVFWPEDLLAPDFPNLRVLTFGYESAPTQFLGSVSQNNVFTLSRNLLANLADARVSNSRRPLLFICHSLGGILTKKALDISQQASVASEYYRDIRISTSGVIFFGTPHAGFSISSWSQLYRSIAGVAASTNPNLLADLDSSVDNGRLDELRDDFNKMLGPRREGKFWVQSFQETRSMAPVPHTPGMNLVVPLASSGINHEYEVRVTIDANHSEMCRFGGKEDPNYQTVRAAVERYIKEATQPVANSS